MSAGKVEHKGFIMSVIQFDAKSQTVRQGVAHLLRRDTSAPFIHQQGIA